MNESNLIEDFDSFRSEGLQYKKAEYLENRLKLQIGENFDDQIVRLFAIKEHLGIYSYLSLLMIIRDLHITPDFFENFMKLSKSDQNQLNHDLQSKYVPGLAVLLNLTEALILVDGEINQSNIEDLLNSLENTECFSRNSHYGSVSEHRIISKNFEDIVMNLCEYVNVDAGEFTFGIGFKNVAYILRNLLGEEHVLELLERIDRENFTCDSESLVKMAISYNSLKDCPLEWIESVASGLTIESMKEIFEANHIDHQQFSVSNN